MAQKFVIEISHQGYGKWWQTSSFEETATKYEGWDWYGIDTIEEAVDLFGSMEEIPEELLSILNAGIPAVEEVWGNGNIYFWAREAFDPERRAEEYLLHDNSRSFIIESKEDAENLLEDKGHGWMEVRKAAREILECAEWEH